MNRLWRGRGTLLGTSSGRHACLGPDALDPCARPVLQAAAGSVLIRKVNLKVKSPELQSRGRGGTRRAGAR